MGDGTLAGHPEVIAVSRSAPWRELRGRKCRVSHRTGARARCGKDVDLALWLAPGLARWAAPGQGPGAAHAVGRGVHRHRVASGRRAFSSRSPAAIAAGCATTLEGEAECRAPGCGEVALLRRTRGSGGGRRVWPRDVRTGRAPCHDRACRTRQNRAPGAEGPCARPDPRTMTGRRQLRARGRRG